MRTLVIVPRSKIGLMGGCLAATALLGLACSNNNNKSNSNTAATATKAPTTAATTAPAAASPAATAAAASPTRAASPAADAGSPAARAASPVAGAASTTSPAADLRVTLDRLLSEHADLAVLAMQKGYDGAPDFKDAANQLNANTDALSKAIDSVYPGAGDKFKALWSAHIGMFVDYVQGTAMKDDAKKAKAKADLDNYRKDFGAFLNGANPNLPADAVAGLLQTHVNELLSAFDSYVAKDYAKAYAQFDESHAHMFMTGDALAAGIVKQSPEKFAAVLNEETNFVARAFDSAATFAYTCTLDTSGLGLPAVFAGVQ